MGMIDVCDIFHPPGLGVFQRIFPDSSSTAMISGSAPGAMMAVSPSPQSSMSGHCPAYHGGTVVPCSLTRSMAHFLSPVFASRHVTWHLGPSARRYLSVTAGTVRDIPWLRLTLTW